MSQSGSGEVMGTDDVVTWLHEAIRDDYPEGAFSCLHVGATMTGPYLDCEDCGAYPLAASRVEMRAWLKREVARAGGSITIQKYDREGNLLSRHRLSGVEIKEPE